MKTPSTTNSFESINEHLNKGTTRTNSFWISLFLLAEMMFWKLRAFRELV
jgi:predicted membrane protein